MSRGSLLLVALLASLATSASAQTPADSSAAPVAPPRVSARDSARAAREAALRALPPGVERRRPLPRASLLAGNVVAGATLTGARALAEGLPARRLPGALAGGAAAGAAFYGAKALVGDGQTVAGFALAYAASSLAQNVAEGGHALSHVRLGLGPLDVRVATPFARGADGERDGPGVALEIEPVSVVAAVVLPLSGHRPRLCRAGLCWRSDDEVRIARDGRRYRRVGRTAGRVVRVWPPFTGRTEAHEGIHVIQGMQVEAATPRGTLRALAGWESDADLTVDLRVDWLTAVAGAAIPLVPYHRLWTEREAVTLSR